MEGAGHCHLGGGEGGRWPTNVGPSGGLGWALLGSWAKPATRSCGSLASQWWWQLSHPTYPHHLSLPPHPLRCPWLALCWAWMLQWGLATCGCPSSHPASCWATLAGELAERLEAPEPWWPQSWRGVW